MITSLQLTFLVKLNFCFKDEDQITCNNSVVSVLCDDDRGHPTTKCFQIRQKVSNKFLYALEARLVNLELT